MKCPSCGEDLTSEHLREELEFYEARRLEIVGRTELIHTGLNWRDAETLLAYIKLLKIAMVLAA